MLFNKKDERGRLLEAGAADQRRLEALQGQLAALAPQWEAAQEEAERLAALHDSIGQTYVLGVHEEWWNARSKTLEADLKAACARRDALTVGVCGEITATKTRIFKRCSAIGGAFGSWAWRVSQELPDSTMASELLAARKRVDDSRNISEIVGIAEHWADQIESTPSTTTPLFRLNDSIRLACEAA